MFQRCDLTVLDATSSKALLYSSPNYRIATMEEFNQVIMHLASMLATRHKRATEAKDL